LPMLSLGIQHVLSSSTGESQDQNTSDSHEMAKVFSERVVPKLATVKLLISMLIFII
jgi:hypothetical protein